MKKIKQILIGTHNKGKFKDLSFLLPKNLKKLSPINLRIKSPKETGNSFKANSELKASYFFKKTGLPSLSDDSGLCIEELNNKPGIHSSRWAKRNGGFNSAMRKIIKLLKNKSTKAKFVCSSMLCRHTHGTCLWCNARARPEPGGAALSRTHAQ